MHITEDKINILLEDSARSKTYDLKASIELAAAALELCKEEKHNPLKAKALSQLSLYYMITGKYDECFNLSQKSIKLYESLQDEVGIAHSKYTLAGFYFRTNNIQLGFVNLVDALSVYKNHEDYYNISRCKKFLGSIYQYINDEQNAIDSFKNAITAAKRIDDLILESNVYNNLASIHLKNGEIELANELISKSIAIKKKNNDLRGLAFAIYGKAKIDFVKKDYKASEDAFLTSLAMHEDIGDKFGMALIYNKLANLYLVSEKIDLAKKTLQIGIDLCNEFSISLIKLKLIHVAYRISKFEGNILDALMHLENYQVEKELIFNVQNIKIIENYELLIQIQTMQRETEIQHEKTKLLAKDSKIKEETRIRQEFLSNMSHEIRTPLNAVTTISQMLSENPDIEDKTLIDSLRFSSNHLMQIINDILDFTKLDLGKMTLHFSSCNFRLFLESFWNTYEIQTRDKAVKFILNVDFNLSEYYIIDETKTTQVLGNIVNNAIKFTDSGIVTLDVSLSRRSKTTDTVLFKISDTGIGIDKENFSKIFDNFSQIKSGITRKKDGAGLGLSISKKIIELYKSEINIESIVGKGSEFSFLLELERSIQSESTILPNVAEKRREINVLLAEDNAINALMARKLLSNWGINNDHAINGLEATEKAKEKKYDYILMDIHMPVLDGYQAAMNIKTFKNLNQSTPIFALTADVAADDKKEYSMYFDAIFLKPLEIEKLKAALK